MRGDQTLQVYLHSLTRWTAGGKFHWKWTGHMPECCKVQHCCLESVFQINFKGCDVRTSKSSDGLLDHPRQRVMNIYNSPNSFSCPFHTDFDPGEQQDQCHSQQGPQPSHQAAAPLPVQERAQGHAPQHAQEPAGAAHPWQLHHQDQKGHLPGHGQHHRHGYETINAAGPNSENV